MNDRIFPWGPTRELSSLCPKCAVPTYQDLDIGADVI